MSQSPPDLIPARIDLEIFARHRRIGQSKVWAHDTLYASQITEEAAQLPSRKSFPSEALLANLRVLPTRFLQEL